jgi:putative transposase
VKPSLAGVDLKTKEGFFMPSIPNPQQPGKFSFADTVQAFLCQDGLPFSNILDGELIAQTFARYAQPLQGIYTHAIVLWAFLSQVLRDGKEASCQSAVARIIAHLRARNLSTPTSDTGDYCRARAKLPEAALQELACHVADQAEQQAEPKWLWKGRHAELIDGFTFLMPDTAQNQKVYPQHAAQKPGIGFPIARVTAILSLATGCLLAAAIGPFSGKETGETALLRRLLTFFGKGDVVVADRYFAAYWLVATLLKMGVDVCFRQVEERNVTMFKKKRLGRNEHLMVWKRPAKSKWMTEAFYDALPEQIVVRRLKYQVNVPGRKQDSFVILTTLTEVTGEQAVSYDDLAELYQFRWNAELDVRSIKTYLNLHHVRCKSPEMVHREFWTTLLAYNLIRVTLANSAALHDRQPRELSFVSGCQFVLAAWQELPYMGCVEQQRKYALRLLSELSRCVVGDRPGRLEPRVVKKRKDRYRLMVQPRDELRRRLSSGDNGFES